MHTATNSNDGISGATLDEVADVGGNSMNASSTLGCDNNHGACCVASDVGKEGKCHALAKCTKGSPETHGWNSPGCPAGCKGTGTGNCCACPA